MERRYTILNVFTQSAQGGNPLAVFPDGEGLDDETMQRIARELGLSETVFVLPPQHKTHTAAIRIFTPAAELPFAGHPVVGTAVFLAQERVWQNSGNDCDALVVLEAKGGILRVGVKPDPHSVPFAEFDTPSLPQDAGDAAPSDRLAAALGLAPTEIGFENFKPCRFKIGPAFTFVPVSGLEAIGRAHIVEQYWTEAFGAGPHAAAYLYCRDTVRHKAAFHARCFAPGMGVAEDPATGSAVAAFAGVINRFDEPPQGVHNEMIEQGIEMGRPCEIFLEFEVVGRQLRNVRIGGCAMRVEDKTFRL